MSYNIIITIIIIFVIIIFLIILMNYFNIIKLSFVVNFDVNALIKRFLNHPVIITLSAMRNLLSDK